MSFGSELRNMRERCGLSQESLAELLGVRYQSIQHYESDRRVPRPPKLRALAGILGVRAELLFDLATRRKDRPVPMLGSPQFDGRSSGEPPPAAPQESQHIKDLLEKTKEVLLSKNLVIASALTSNIVAFHASVKNEEKAEIDRLKAEEDRKRAQLTNEALQARVEDLEKKMVNKGPPRQNTGTEKGT